jgi:hypothetical protein
VNLVYFAKAMADALFPGNEQPHTVGARNNLRLCLQNSYGGRERRSNREDLRNQEYER